MPSPGHAAFAFDLAATGDHGGRLLRTPRWRHVLGRVTVEDSYSWGRSVHAPASGVIVEAHDGWPDRRRLSLFRDAASMLLSRPELTPEGIRPFAGNYLVLRADSGYIFLAHLRSGSIKISAGDVVSLGQPLAEVGNSGLSLLPQPSTIPESAPCRSAPHHERRDAVEVLRSVAREHDCEFGRDRRLKYAPFPLPIDPQRAAARRSCIAATWRVIRAIM